jgi:ribonuclease D
MDKIIFCEGDLSMSQRDRILEKCKDLAVDSETTGLNALESNLSIIQLCADDHFFIIRINTKAKPKYLATLFSEKKIKKILHHAPFDLAFIMHHLDINCIQNVVCTKIAYKILYGIEQKNSLKELVSNYFGVLVDKSMQKSDWDSELTDEQINYAINDVRYLTPLWYKLEQGLQEKGQMELAQKCFDFLPSQAFLSNKGIENIFKY